MIGKLCSFEIIKKPLTVGIAAESQWVFAYSHKMNGLLMRYTIFVATLCNAIVYLE